MITLLSSLALASASFSGTVTQPNEELGKAFVCLTENTASRLSAEKEEPNKFVRWSWAIGIVNQCQDALNAAADSPEAVHPFLTTGANGVTKRQLLRSEGLYYVDRLIREHFEGESAPSEN